MSVAAGIANRLYMLAAAPERHRFERALRIPAAAQHEVLMRIVLANASTAFGRRHGFLGIRSVADYRARVTVHEYEQLEQDILRTAEGSRRVLTTDPAICFELTGGTSGGNKLVPYTASLLREFSAATMPWISDLLRHRPVLRNGRAYWAVSPPARAAAMTRGGIPIGLDHDSEYFPALVRTLLEPALGTPRALSRIPDVDGWRYVTLRALIAVQDLVFVSVWNPTFLTLLSDALDERWERLLHDLETGVLSIALDPSLRHELNHALPPNPRLASYLRRRFHRRVPEDLGELWPSLALISCWTDAHAMRSLSGLARRFPRVELQGKGLLATEGVVSIPLFEAGGCVAAVTSHFLEFLPQDATDRAVGVEELEVGHSYEVLLTTSGGLYRYRLKDVVRVEGFRHATPILRFQGRADRTSDLVGEKLTPVFVEQVLRRAALDANVEATFAMLAPVGGADGLPARYELLVECSPDDADRLAAAVEASLNASHHYALCRRLGQLDPVHAVVVRDGAREYEKACLARGQRLGSIKPVALDVFAEVR